MDSTDLSNKARELIADPQNAIFFCSTASIREITIKQALGKLEIPKQFTSVLADQSFEPLSISVEHAHAVAKLPAVHKDPFDRMLVAQAKHESLVLLTHDPVFTRYPIKSIVV